MNLVRMSKSKFNHAFSGRFLLGIGVYLICCQPILANEQQSASLSIVAKNPRFYLVRQCSEGLYLGQICRDNQSLFYQIDIDDNLGFIASKLYGTVKFVPKIQEWNSDIDLNRITVGTKLKLDQFPRYLSKKEQSFHLMKQFAIKFKLGKEWLGGSTARLDELEKLKLETPKEPVKKSFAIAAIEDILPEVNDNSQDSVKAATNSPSKVRIAKASTQKLSKTDRAILAALTFSPSEKLVEFGSQQYDKKNYKWASLIHSIARKKDANIFQSWLQELLILKRCASNQEFNAVKRQLEKSKLNSKSKKRILSIIKNNKINNCESSEITEITKIWSIDFLLNAADTLKSNEKFQEAVLLSQIVRKKDPKQVKAWILEITSLKKLSQTDQAKRAVQGFLKIHPEMSALPFLHAH